MCVGDAFQDLCSDEGFITALLYFLQTGDDVLIWLATVCSTWVFMCRHTTGRSESTPMGNVSYGGVSGANKMVARSGVVIALSYVWLKAWGLEQPDKTLMVRHDTIKFIKSCVDAVQRQIYAPVGMQWHTVTTFMGCFGHERPKKSEIYSNRTWMTAMARDLHEAGRVFPSMEESGIAFIRTDKRVTGKTVLKETQSYTPEFAQAVFNTWSRMEHGKGHFLKSLDSPLPSEIIQATNDGEAHNAWRLACIGSALQTSMKRREA